MAQFLYKAVDEQGRAREGTIDAVSQDVAIAAIQRRGLIVSEVRPAQKDGLLSKNISIFENIKTKDIVILSRQITTLFEAQISALRAFRLLAAETQNPALQDRLNEVSNDLQSGSTIADALQKHPKVFRHFMYQWYAPVKKQVACLRLLLSWLTTLTVTTK